MNSRHDEWQAVDKMKDMIQAMNVMFSMLPPHRMKSGLGIGQPPRLADGLELQLIKLTMLKLPATSRSQWQASLLMLADFEEKVNICGVRVNFGAIQILRLLSITTTP